MRRLALVAAAALLLTGCGNDKPAADTPSPARTTAPAPSPTPKQAEPKVGDCYQLSFQDATSPTSSAAPTPCTGPHTAVTIFVGKLDQVVDGHLLAVDSTRVQQQIADTCPTKVGSWVGGDEDRQRLSRFTSIWFSPTLADADAGASWFRCDLVAVSGDDQLAGLRGTVKDALGPDDALDRFGSCGTSAPSAAGFQRLICSRPHTWQAVTVFPIPQDAQYLGKDVQSAADDACKVEAQQRATDPLVYSWSFEWPTRDEWDAGRRYGLCWVPTKS